MQEDKCVCVGVCVGVCLDTSYTLASEDVYEEHCRRGISVSLEDGDKVTWIDLYACWLYRWRC